MRVQPEGAPVALNSVLVALTQSWDVLGPGVQRELTGLLARAAPELAAADAGNFAAGCLRLLVDLRSLGGRLPANVSGTLRAVEQGPTRSAESFQAQRERVLAGITQIADQRSFRDAPGLARQLQGMIARHQDRLSPEHRALWVRLEGEFRRTGDADAYLRAVERYLGEYRSLRRAMERAKTWHSVTARSIGPLPDARSNDAPPLHGALSRYRNRAQVPERGAGIGAGAARGPAEGDGVNGAESLLTRHANVHFPAIVLASQRSIPLVVHLASRHDPASRSDAAASSAGLAPGEVVIVLHAEGFVVDGSIGGAGAPDRREVRVVTVAAAADAEPVIFFVSPQSLGKKRIAVDLYQADRRLHTVAFSTEVVRELPGVPLAPVGLHAVPVALSLSASGQPPDLELRVTLGTDQRTLSFMLHSPTERDYHFRHLGEVRMAGDPAQLLGHTLSRLSQLARQPEAGRNTEAAARAAREIADIGCNLYRDLFPPAFKLEYRNLRDTHAGKTLLITSDEPWIPWEMVKPWEAGEAAQPSFIDPCLCETFHVARWLAGRGAPGGIVMKTAAIVVPPGDLAAAAAEAAYFARLHQQEWTIEVAPPMTTIAAIEDRFRQGGTQLFHFACHGNFETRDPNESRLRLADGSLRPSQIVGDRESGLRRSRPLVFLNACHSAEAGFALTGLGGWAERFIESGAAAFVGTLWEVADGLAALFAAEFYNRLWGLDGHSGETLGAAFHGARQAVKARDASNPTWLAYVLYGDPQARVRLGEEA